jgi:hypothetical protein
MEVCLNRRTERVFWDSVINKFYRNSNFVSAFSPSLLWLYVTAFVWILAVALFSVLHTSSESVLVTCTCTLPHPFEHQTSWKIYFYVMLQQLVLTLLERKALETYSGTEYVIYHQHVLYNYVYIYYVFIVYLYVCVCTYVRNIRILFPKPL